MEVSSASNPTERPGRSSTTSDKTLVGAANPNTDSLAKDYTFRKPPSDASSSSQNRGSSLPGLVDKVKSKIKAKLKDKETDSKPSSKPSPLANDFYPDSRFMWQALAETRM
ncbi:hypothetical protein GGS23DRAFT_596258 [Durotheca rogersii]|uniref:uncharacterized protein n=1 Tax=Durotheca rogersii TaxID=419775 RepID=UPI00221FC5BE|nr:uncharacterized protein GGS23DRAFT_596258 [Durotheca rogersii]KAI5863753.1 hypothetical protein GGS23DRAFT_596258 [Durotheca rogersii]